MLAAGEDIEKPLELYGCDRFGDSNGNDTPFYKGVVEKFEFLLRAKELSDMSSAFDLETKLNGMVIDIRDELSESGTPEAEIEKQVHTFKVDIFMAATYFTNSGFGKHPHWYIYDESCIRSCIYYGDYEIAAKMPSLTNSECRRKVVGTDNFHDELDTRFNESIIYYVLVADILKFVSQKGYKFSKTDFEEYLKSLDCLNIDTDEQMKEAVSIFLTLCPRDLENLNFGEIVSSVTRIFGYDICEIKFLDQSRRIIDRDSEGGLKLLDLPQAGIKTNSKELKVAKEISGKKKDSSI